MQHAQHRSGSHCHHQGCREVVYDHVHLGLAVVLGQYDALVDLAVVAGKLIALVPQIPSKIFTIHGWRIAAAFYINQKHRVHYVLLTRVQVGFVVVGRVSPGRVGHVYVGAPVDLAGAAFPTGAPGAVEETPEILSLGDRANDGLGKEIGHQCAYGRVDVERDQEQQRATPGNRNQSQTRRSVKSQSLFASPLGLLGSTLGHGVVTELQELLSALLLLPELVVQELTALCVQQEFRGAVPSVAPIETARRSRVRHLHGRTGRRRGRRGRGHPGTTSTSGFLATPRARTRRSDDGARLGMHGDLEALGLLELGSGGGTTPGTFAGSWSGLFTGRHGRVKGPQPPAVNAATRRLGYRLLHAR